MCHCAIPPAEFNKKSPIVRFLVKFCNGSDSRSKHMTQSMNSECIKRFRLPIQAVQYFIPESRNNSGLNAITDIFSILCLAVNTLT